MGFAQPSGERYSDQILRLLVLKERLVMDGARADERSIVAGRWRTRAAESRSHSQGSDHQGCARNTCAWSAPPKPSFPHGLSIDPKLDRERVAVPRKGISGGYLIEGSDEPFDRGFASLARGHFYGHKDPGREQLRDEEAAWIAAYVRTAEQAVAARDGSWRAAVDYLLLQELFKNYDAFSRSVFLAKGSDRPLELGPVWDLDRAMGFDLTENRVGVHGWITAGRPWAADLLADRAFAQRLVARWQELRRDKDLLRSMLRRLDRWGVVLRGERARNARRWPQKRLGSPTAEHRRLRAWLVDRARWIDANVGALATR